MHFKEIVSSLVSSEVFISVDFEFFLVFGVYIYICTHICLFMGRRR